MIEKITLGLSPWQLVAVVVVLPATSIGALLLAWAFRRMNG